MTRVLAFGTFDGLHPGHLFMLGEAQKRGELLVVVARDANVVRLKGHLPEHNETERCDAICKAFPKAQVMLGSADDFFVPVRELQPDLILLGYDQMLPPGIVEDDFPCPVERLPSYLPDRYKSSKLRNK